MLFRWQHIHVRVHMFFLLFAAFTLFLSATQAAERSGNLAWVAAGTVGILLFSVLLHELGHGLVALHFGGECRLIVLGPLGGLCPCLPPPEPRHELAMHAAGPLVNLGICAISGLVVASLVGAEWMELLYPLAPRNLFSLDKTGTVLLASKLIFWINWVLFLVNLIPAYPFDGGRVLRSAVLALNPELGNRRAASLVALLAKTTALLLLIAAAWRWNDESNRVLPVWFSLVLLALFVYFSAKQEEERTDDVEPDEELFGYDFSQGYTSLERSSPITHERVSPFRRWLEERRRVRMARQQQLEREEESRVDEILQRLHEQGFSSLSTEDRSLLKRVSERLRHRQGNG